MSDEAIPCEIIDQTDCNIWLPKRNPFNWDILFRISHIFFHYLKPTVSFQCFMINNFFSMVNLYVLLWGKGGEHSEVQGKHVKAKTMVITTYQSPFVTFGVSTSNSQNTSNICTRHQ